MWWKINQDLLPMKGHYFLFNAGTAPVQPFMQVYARQLGFSSVVVGTIYSILPFTGMLAKILFGALADRYHMQKFLFLLFQILTIVGFFSIQFVPELPVVSESVAHMTCDTETNLKKCSGVMLNECAAEKYVDGSNYDNSTVSCHLSCDLGAEFVRELCTTWRAPQYCLSNETFSKFDFDAVIALGRSEQVGNCTYFHVKAALLDDNTRHIPYCTSLVQANCQVLSCTDAKISQIFTTTAKQEVNVLTLYQFWLFFWMLVASWVGMAVVVSIADAICFELLGERASLYGNQRLWGSIGWGILAIITGLVIDAFSKDDTEKNYTPIFYLCLIFLSMDVICSYVLKYDQTKMSASIFKDVGKLFVDIKIVVFMVWCVFFGICTGLIWNFLYWLIEDLAEQSGCETVKWMKTIQGLVGGIQCFLGELPSFFLSGWILKKIGHIHAMSLVLLVVGVRFMLYSLVSNPWWILPIEVLQFAFGLFYPTMTSYASIVAPPGTEATIQGLVGAIFEGIGVSLGSLLGGFAFQAYGGTISFRLFGGIALCMFLVHVAVQCFLPKRLTQLDAHTKDFNGTAKYAAPNEAISMLEDS